MIKFVFPHTTHNAILYPTYVLSPLKLIKEKEKNKNNKMCPSSVIHPSTVRFCAVPLQLLPKTGALKHEV